MTAIFSAFIGLRSPKDQWLLEEKPTEARSLWTAECARLCHGWTVCTGSSRIRSLLNRLKTDPGSSK